MNAGDAPDTITIPIVLARGLVEPQLLPPLDHDWDEARRVCERCEAARSDVEDGKAEEMCLGPQAVIRMVYRLASVGPMELEEPDRMVVDVMVPQAAVAGEIDAEEFARAIGSAVARDILDGVRAVISEA